jgi:hypothetical protein
VQDTFAPLATHPHGEVALVLKDRETYSRAPGEILTLAEEVAGVCRIADEEETSVDSDDDFSFEPTHGYSPPAADG